MAGLSAPWKWQQLQPLCGGAERSAGTAPGTSCPTPAAALEQRTGQAGPLWADMTEQHMWACPSPG